MKIAISWRFFQIPHDLPQALCYDHPAVVVTLAFSSKLYNYYRLKQASADKAAVEETMNSISQQLSESDIKRWDKATPHSIGRL